VTLDAKGGVVHSAPPRFAYHRDCLHVLEQLHAPGDKQLILLLGLGGGALASHAASRFPQAVVVAVELDEGIARVARDHFGLRTLPEEEWLRLEKYDGVEAEALRAFIQRAGQSPGATHVIVGDGLRVITLLAKLGERPLLTSMILDVNAGAHELSSGLSFPPSNFLSPPFVTAARGLLESGTFLMNLGARSPIMLNRALSAVKSVFPAAAQLRSHDQAEEDLNCIVLAASAFAPQIEALEGIKVL
jgi:hypothetical protein